MAALVALPGALGAAYRPHDTSELRCLVSATFREARGEVPAGRRAVLDTIYNRAVKSGMTLCEVVAQPKQFPWRAKLGLVQLTPEVLSTYREARAVPRVLSKDYIYFNRGFTFGTACRKIGHHRFCREPIKKEKHVGKD